ncbi:MAG: molybdenum cofactor guanylyltransferase, partial [Hyphomicrobiales bacterium]
RAGRTKIIAVILAGGRGMRLGGVRKADLRIGGERLLNRVARTFEGHADQLLIASARLRPLDLSPGAIAIDDESDESLGPLAGLRAAVTHIGSADDSDLLISAAADTPFLPENYVKRLRDAVGADDAAYAAWGEGFYPTSAAWRLPRLRAALDNVPTGAGPKAILSLLCAAKVDWTDEASANPFANINTLADLLALQRRALNPRQTPGLRGL